MTVGGHLFLVHGDVHRLDCDGWLLPTDSLLRIEPWAAPAFPDGVPRFEPPAGWGSGLRTLRHDRDQAPPAWLTHVGADERQPIDWYVDGVRQFVTAASRAVTADPSPFGPSGRQPRRDRPLLGLPLVATGRGGMKDRPDQILLELVPALIAVANEAGVDLALVTPDRLAYDAAQAARRRLGGRQGTFAGLAPESLEVAAELGERMPRHVGLFLGAGISMGAGLPSWRDLLVAVADRLGDPDLATELQGVVAERRLDPLDVATLLAARVTDPATGDTLRSAVVDLTRSPRHALAHGLLASTGVSRAVTTNYDDLYEQAFAGAGVGLDVLPYQRPRPDGRWLLKLHGDIGHPDDIVLTRQDFLRYAADRAALTGVVHALLLTEHLVFVGYSLSDPNFHRTVDGVRQALARAGHGVGEPFGTVVVAEAPPRPVRDLWGADLRVVVPGDLDVRGAAAFRAHDRWLDALALHASDTDAHLLSPRFAGLLDQDEQVIAAALAPLAAKLDAGTLTGTAADRIRELLTDLGHTPI